jgi:hypothetical protein
MASPHYIDGRSKYKDVLPVRLQEDYEHLRSRKDLLESSNEVALLDLLAKDVVRRIDSGESAVAWERVFFEVGQLNQTWERFEAAMVEKDFEGAQVVLAEIRPLITKMQGLRAKRGEEQDTRAELQRIVDGRTKIAERENKRIDRQGDTMTAFEAKMIFGSILGCVNENIVAVSIAGLIKDWVVAQGEALDLPKQTMSLAEHITRILRSKLQAGFTRITASGRDTKRIGKGTI